MENKEIYIDRVDVSEWTDGEIRYNFEKHSPKAIRQIAFDLYKQLKRKGQECEELKEECNEYFELMAIRTEVLAKIANKLGMNTGIIENNELFCKIDQLKVENEKLDKEVKLLRQYKCSKQASYESMQVERNKAVSRNQDLLKQVEKWQEKCNKLETENEKLKHDNGYEVGALEKTIDNLIAENGKLKQTLTEIKEIAKIEYPKSLFNETFVEVINHCPYFDCGKCKCLENKEKQNCGGFICSRKQSVYYQENTIYFKQILQKISECEVKNGFRY